MFINQLKTTQLNNQNKYQQFIQWAKANGALISDSILYPTVFGNQEFVGVSATQHIPPNTVIIAIPNKLIISANKAYYSELHTIFRSNPNFFDESITNDADFNCLSVFIFWHKLQKDNSFWYPYLNVVEQFTLFEWKSRDIYHIQEQSVIDEFLYVQKEMEKAWHQMRKVLNNYPALFPTLTEQHKDIYYWSCEFVMTRCFGWTLPSTSLIPFADMLNHSTEATTYHLIKCDYEIIGKSENKYQIKKDKADLSLLGKIEQNNLEQIHQSYLTQKQAYIEKNKIFLINDNDQEEDLNNKINLINYSILKLWKEKQIWELDFESSSDSEDNDSDESDSDRETAMTRIDKIKSQELKQYKLQQQIKQQQYQEEQVNNCQQLIQKIIPQNTQFKMNDIHIHPQIKGRNQEIQKEEEHTNQKDNDDQYEQSSDSDSEKDFDWYEENDDQIYFCITTSGPIKANEQVCTYYGRRNNRFFLLWYGFTMAKNKYNSYYFRLWMNPNPMPFNECIYQKILMKDLITLNHLKYGHINDIPIKELSMKMKMKINRISDNFIIHLRMFLMNYYTEQDANKLLLTIPKSIDFEIFVMDFAHKFLCSIVQKFKTTYNEDLQYIKQANKPETYFAVQYNLDMKEIILLQIQYIKQIIQILLTMKQNPNQNIKDIYMQFPIESIRPIRKYIKYL